MSVNFETLALATGDDDVLSTRERGRDAGRRAQDEFSDANALVVSFAGVGLASPLYLEELLDVLHLPSFTAERATLIVAGDYNEDVRAALELVLRHRRYVLAGLEAGGIVLLGGNQQQAETMRVAVELGTFLSADLSERLGLTVPATHQRLNPLLDAGALVREVDDTVERGARHVYSAPDPVAVDRALAGAVSGPRR